MSTPTRAPMPLRVAIVDDESGARRGLRLLLSRDPEVEIVGEAATGDEAIELLSRTRPDIAFLDVQIPEPDGFSVLHQIGAASAPVVVFVTAYEDYAVGAFEVNAVDYLLKPYDDARFGSALARAKDAAGRRRTGPGDSRLAQLLDYLRKVGPAAEIALETRARDRILVKSSGEIFFLKPEEIDWIEAEGDYVRFHVAGQTHLMRETMTQLSDRLDVQRFVRVHRSAIVNIDRVRKLTPVARGEYALILQDGAKLRIGRGYHEALARLKLQAG